MRKKVVKTVAIILVYLITSGAGIYFSVLCGGAIVSNFIVSMKTGNADFSGAYITFQEQNATEGYKTAKAVLKQSEGFGALVLDDYMEADIYDCGEEAPQFRTERAEYMGSPMKSIIVNNYTRHNRYNHSEVYFSAIAESGYVELKQGRWIDAERTRAKGEPLELLLPEDSDIPLDTKVWVHTGIEDENGDYMLLPAVVVGKVKTVRMIPCAVRQPAYSYISDNIDMERFTPIYIENPFDEYPLPPAYFEDKFEGTEGITFRVIEDTDYKQKNEDPKIFQKQLTQAAQESGGSVQPNWAYNANVADVARAQDISPIFFLSLVTLALVISQTIYTVCAVVRIWRRKEIKDA